MVKTTSSLLVINFIQLNETYFSRCFIPSVKPSSLIKNVQVLVR